MGLLDWLTEGIGSMGGSGSPSPPPMPPMQQTGADGPPATPPLTFQRPEFARDRPMPQGTDPMTAGGDTPNGPGLTPPPVPMPMPRPPGADAGSAALPPAATPSSGTGMPPGPPTSLAPGLPGPSAPQGGPLSRMLGLNPNPMRTVVGSLGAGLTAAGNSAGKSPAQALFSGAGASLEGGQKTDDKTLEQQQKYLAQAIAAKQAGNTELSNQYLNMYRIAQTEKLKQDALDKANGTDAKTGINTPEALYLSAVQRTNADPRLSLLRDQVRAGTAPANAPQLMSEMRDKILKEHMGNLKLSQKDADKVAKQPGMSMENPIKPKSQADLDGVKPGQWVVGPDGQAMQKKVKPAVGSPGAATPAVSGGALDPAASADPEAASAEAD